MSTILPLLLLSIGTPAGAPAAQHPSQPLPAGIQRVSDAELRNIRGGHRIGVRGTKADAARLMRETDLRWMDAAPSVVMDIWWADRGAMVATFGVIQ